MSKQKIVFNKETGRATVYRRTLHNWLQWLGLKPIEADDDKNTYIYEMTADLSEACRKFQFETNGYFLCFSEKQAEFFENNDEIAADVLKIEGKPNVWKFKRTDELKELINQWHLESYDNKRYYGCRSMNMVNFLQAHHFYPELSGIDNTSETPLYLYRRTEKLEELTSYFIVFISPLIKENEFISYSGLLTSWLVEHGHRGIGKINNHQHKRQYVKFCDTEELMLDVHAFTEFKRDVLNVKENRKNA